MLIYISVYLFGAVCYGLIEILWRGYTHWTMLILGGLCSLAIYSVNCMFSGSSIFFRAFISALIITALELVSGIIINLKLGWGVWDYSLMKYNFLGQISLEYSFFWYLLSIPASLLSTAVSRSFFTSL